MHPHLPLRDSVHKGLKKPENIHILEAGIKEFRFIFLWKKKNQLSR